jgi:O-antigen/teichoic acid export membrane protein
MFIVTPYITKDPVVYGIFAICMSVTIFLGYADLGFLKAGQKYAAECYGRDDRIEEMKHIGFGIFVLLLFTILLSAVFFYFGAHPHLLIRDLDAPRDIAIASSLFFILALFSTPLTVLQRMTSMIFNIRLEGYVNQRISIITSLITIGSAFYYFRQGHYEIVQYFLFSQIFSLIGVIVAIWLAKRRYNYNIIQLFRYIRFNSEIYKMTYSLAYSGLYIMLVWIVFNELDKIVIGKYLGADRVAIFAIGFASAAFFRSIFGILFNPFTIRANYYVGVGDEEGLKKFTQQLFLITAPLVILPTVALGLVAKPFILTWVGSNYTESIVLAKYFIFASTLSFISYIASMILVAKVRIKEMYVVTTIRPLIYWLGIIGTISLMGLESFGLFKLIATFASQVYFFYILSKYLDVTLTQLFRKLYSILPPLLFLVSIMLVANNYFPQDKSKINFLIVTGTTGFALLISFIIQYYSSESIRVFGKNIMQSVYAKNK